MTTVVYDRPTFKPPHEGRHPREDGLPEHIAYHDEGCDLFSSCLTCPLPRCRYDEPGGARTMLNRARDEQIRRLHLDFRLTIDEIAIRYRVSRRTVFRVLQHVRPHKKVTDGVAHARKPQAVR